MGPSIHVHFSNAFGFGSEIEPLSSRICFGAGCVQEEGCFDVFVFVMLFFPSQS